MSVTVTGNNTAAIIALLTAAVSEAVGEEGEDARKDWRELLDEPKHGRTYGTHIASAPGEAPANETGTLSQSLQVKPMGAFGAEVAATGEGLRELEFLETGTAKMAPRPSVERIQEIVDKRFQKRLRAAVRKAAG